MKRTITLGTLAALAALMLAWGGLAHEGGPVVDGIVNDGEYDHHYTNEDLNMKVHWTVDIEEGAITFALEAPTTGWLGIGFTSTGLKKRDADMILGFFHDEDGETDILDAFQQSPISPPMADTFLGGTDDIESAVAIQTEADTTLEFVRKLNTGDEFDAALTPGQQTMLLAYGEQDNLNNYHGQNRVAVTVDLFAGTVSAG
ncbi:MAG: DOMON domain-containing protein [Candidatus Bipolaricaulia bacterium]